MKYSGDEHEDIAVSIRRIVNNLVVLVVTLLLSVGSTSAMIGSSPTQEDQSFQWIQIPDWLAGTWQTKFQTIIDSIDCRTGRRLVNKPVQVAVALIRTIGTQQDANGRIWHCAATPYVRSIETAGYYESQTIERVSVLASETNRLMLRTAGKVTRWMKHDRQAYDSFYEITDVAYSPLNNGVIKVEMTIMDFDIMERPLRVSKSVLVERRIKPFSIVNYDERGNLQEKFMKFQMETGIR